jgi:transcriptional regulator with XRE-family HTH domain
MSILSQRLREARMNMNPRVTQRDVAKRLERSPSAVNLWEKGKSEPGSEKLVELAKWFGVSTDWLLGMDQIRGEK